MKSLKITMNRFSFILICNLLLAFQIVAQNQLPLENGEFEALNGSAFSQWTNQANHGGSANFSVETNNLIPGSTKAVKSQIIALGTNNYDVSTKSDYGFQVVAGEQYTVSFYAKIEGATSRQLKLVFQSEIAGSFQGQDLWITDQWQRFTHTFTVPISGNQNKVKFWYLQAGVTYYLDEVSIVSGNYVSVNTNITYQTIDGFGAGIKRRTEDLYKLEVTLREQIEAYCFQDLEVNMIRFFVYYDLEPSNDNNDPFVLDETQLDWTRYDSDPSNWRTRYVGEALNNAFSLSTNGFDHVIGNCNSAPGWLKTNGQHNNGGTLIPGGESEYSEFLIAFINGMQSRYNIGVTAISPTNEPDYQVAYESMNTTPSELSSIISNLNGRLTTAGLDNVKIISPECFRVESSNANKSTTNYINSMFSSTVVQSAIDVVATHTYADPNHTANWNALKTAASNKPVWVTESASLNSTDQSMTDAAHYIKWMLKGFNEGGMTAYMMHLFYEKEDLTGGYSSLVAWTDTGNIILPKRYYTFKHFANLIKKGYKLIDSQVVKGNVMVGAFKSPDGTKVILQVFNEGVTQDVSVDVPIGTTSISHYITSDTNNENFTLNNDISYTQGERYTTINVASMSLHSLVYTIDASTLSLNELESNSIKKEYKLYPNPSNKRVELKFPEIGNYNISIYTPDGVKVFDTKTLKVIKYNLDVNTLANGLYFIKIQPEEKAFYSTIKFIKI